MQAGQTGSSSMLTEYGRTIMQLEQKSCPQWSHQSTVVTGFLPQCVQRLPSRCENIVTTLRSPLSRAHLRWCESPTRKQTCAATVLLRLLSLPVIEPASRRWKAAMSAALRIPALDRAAALLSLVSFCPPQLPPRYTLQQVWTVSQAWNAATQNTTKCAMSAVCALGCAPVVSSLGDIQFALPALATIVATPRSGCRAFALACCASILQRTRREHLRVSRATRTAWWFPRQSPRGLTRKKLHLERHKRFADVSAGNPRKIRFRSTARALLPNPAKQFANTFAGAVTCEFW